MEGAGAACDAQPTVRHAGRPEKIHSGQPVLFPDHAPARQDLAAEQAEAEGKPDSISERVKESAAFIYTLSWHRLPWRSRYQRKCRSLASTLACLGPKHRRRFGSWCLARRSDRPTDARNDGALQTVWTRLPWAPREQHRQWHTPPCGKPAPGRGWPPGVPAGPRLHQTPGLLCSIHENSRLLKPAGFVQRL